jgi:predicted nucleotidyltransferase
MERNIQQILANYFSNQPIEKAWLFGSYSRGENTPHSDVDILVSFTPDSKITLLNYAHIVNDLQRLLRKKVDLVEEGQLLGFATESAEQDKILIYERKNKRS